MNKISVVCLLLTPNVEENERFLTRLQKIYPKYEAPLETLALHGENTSFTKINLCKTNQREHLLKRSLTEKLHFLCNGCGKMHIRINVT